MENGAGHLELGHFIGQLFAAENAVAARQHLAHDAGDRLLAEQAFFIAPMQIQNHRHGLAAIFLWQQRQFQPADFLALGARIDIRLRRIEVLRCAALRFDLVAFHQLLRTRRRRYLGALRLLFRHEDADDAIVALEVARSRRRHLFGSHVRLRIAVLEKQAPVAERNRLRQSKADLLRIVQHFLDLVGFAAAHALYLVACRRRLMEIFDRRDQSIAHRLERSSRFDDGADHLQSRRKSAHPKAEDLRRLAALDQLLVQASVRRIGQDVGRERQRIAVGMQRAGHLVRHRDDLDIAAAPHAKAALAILGRLDGPELRQLARGFRDRAKRMRDPAQRLRRIEFAGDQQHGIIRLIVGAVERLQIPDLDVLDVAAIADRGAAVAVPIVGHALHALHHHLKRRILAALEFVAYHRHFRVEILFRDEGMHHAVGLHVDRPFQVVLAGLEQFVEIGAVERRRGVRLHAAVIELQVDLRKFRRALEQHVFEQMRHAGFAVVLVARADKVGDVDRDGRLGCIGQQQDLQAVVEAVFGDAFDRGDLADALGQGLRGGDLRQQRKNSD